GEAALMRWLVEEAAAVSAETGLPVTYRPHPRGDVIPLDHPHTLDDRERPICFDDVAVVVTYCSSAGYEAILAGVPVRCHSSAFYAPWADLTGNREDLVDRVLATQWTQEEVQAGLAWDFVAWWLTVWAGRWDGGPAPIRLAPTHVSPPKSVGLYADESQSWAMEMATAIAATGAEV